MQRYFIDRKESLVDVVNQRVIIRGEDCHHIITVMRMKIGDQVFVCDEGNTYICEIEYWNSNKTEVELTIKDKIEEERELPFDVTIAHGFVRKEKMEEVIDHITELGANRYIPVIMQRSNVKYNEEKVETKWKRLNKIAKEASEQAHRTKKLEVIEPKTWREFLNISKEYDLCMVAHVDENNMVTIKSCLRNENYTRILILIGPEGGISEKELEDLQTYHFHKVSLGSRVLRTEVAPSYIMSVLNYEWSD